MATFKTDQWYLGHTGIQTGTVDLSPDEAKLYNVSVHWNYNVNWNKHVMHGCARRLLFSVSTALITIRQLA